MRWTQGLSAAHLYAGGTLSIAASERPSTRWVPDGAAVGSLPDSASWTRLRLWDEGEVEQGQGES
jgi:hypothetical protein